MIYPTFSIDPDGNQCINLIDSYFDPNEPIMSMDMMDEPDAMCAWMQLLNAMLEQYDRGYEEGWADGLFDGMEGYWEGGDIL